jgi:hypothetical protein
MGFWRLAARAAAAAILVAAPMPATSQPAGDAVGIAAAPKTPISKPVGMKSGWPGKPGDPKAAVRLRLEPGSADTELSHPAASLVVKPAADDSVQIAGRDFSFRLDPTGSMSDIVCRRTTEFNRAYVEVRDSTWHVKLYPQADHVKRFPAEPNANARRFRFVSTIDDQATGIRLNLDEIVTVHPEGIIEIALQVDPRSTFQAQRISWNMEMPADQYASRSYTLARDPQEARLLARWKTAESAEAMALPAQTGHTEAPAANAPPPDPAPEQAGPDSAQSSSAASGAAPAQPPVPAITESAPTGVLQKMAEAGRGLEAVFPREKAPDPHMARDFNQLRINGPEGPTFLRFSASAAGGAPLSVDDALEDLRWWDDPMFWVVAAASYPHVGDNPDNPLQVSPGEIRTIRIIVALPGANLPGLAR